MNHQILSTLGAQCQPVADGVLYASTQFAMPFYGNAIGGYIQEFGNNRVRISDNADTLFEAVAHGVDWSNVYGTLGKMIDISRVSNAKRFVIIEGTEDDELINASTLLSEKATVIPYTNSEKLLKALAA